VSSTHKIQLLGREFQVRSDSSPEAVEEVELFVATKLSEVAASIPNGDQQLVLLLTLLNIAEEYLTLKHKTEGVDFDSIIRKLDNTLEL